MGCERQTARSRDHRHQVNLAELFPRLDQKTREGLLNVREVSLVVREEHFVLLV